MVIRTSQDYRYDNFLSMLQVQCGDLWASGFPIDFIYLPCPRVGIINFVNHELCWMCFDVITRRMQMGTIRIIKVQQAMYQGLQTNLAVYYAKAGRRGLERKNAPKVFLEGQELPLRQALKSFVAPELIQHYRASFRSSTEASAAPGSENQDGRGWAGRTAQSVPVNLPPEQARRQPSSSSWVPVWQHMHPDQGPSKCIDANSHMPVPTELLQLAWAATCTVSPGLLLEIFGRRSICQAARPWFKRMDPGYFVYKRCLMARPCSIDSCGQHPIDHA